MALHLVYILSFFFLVFPSLAGRPVFKELTLSEVSSQAEWILVVDHLKIEKVKLSCGWDSLRYEVRIVEVLRSKGSEDKLGKSETLSFDPFPTLTRDCHLRKGSSKGASFSAERYASSLDLTKMEKIPRFVIFIKGQKGSFQLVSDNAIEDEKIVRKFLKDSNPEE